jgi:thiamine biosynthesis lipoprotein
MRGWQKRPFPPPSTRWTLESILSRHRADSELSTLNREGRLRNASDPLLDVIAQARQISDLSNGAFDITIKPLVDLYQADHAQGALPGETAVSTTKQLVNYKNIHIEGKTISFAKPGMSITLDGIGKGYIVDAGTAVLRELGFVNVMVEAGGDLMAMGTKEANQPWRIGVQPPRSDTRMTVVGLQNQAAATSGDYMQPFAADLSQHHIIDPRTGYSAPELASVTITAPSVMLADGLGNGRFCPRHKIRVKPG